MDHLSEVRVGSGICSAKVQAVGVEKLCDGLISQCASYSLEASFDAHLPKVSLMLFLCDLLVVTLLLDGGLQAVLCLSLLRSALSHLEAFSLQVGGTQLAFVVMVDDFGGAGADDAEAAEDAIALELLPAGGLVHQIIDELQQVLRLADAVCAKACLDVLDPLVALRIS